ncbi:MAG TPA: hypothetical protein VGF76_24085, partial [Polyangiaceae bacterium]
QVMGIPDRNNAKPYVRRRAPTAAWLAMAIAAGAVATGGLFLATRSSAPAAASAATVTPPPVDDPAPTLAPSGMITIPVGEFTMGDDNDKNARPAHRVKITTSFFIDTT